MMNDAALVRLMSWMSPSFPIGAYSYSHGIEAAVEQGLIGDAADLRSWIEGILVFGSARVDADVLRMAWAAADAGDRDALTEAATLGRITRGSREIALESAAQGDAFMATLRAAWPHPGLADFEPRCYALAVGAVAAVWGVALRPTLLAYLHALAANLVSAGVRLIPLGQTQGQTIIAELESRTLRAVEDAIARSPGDFGSAAVLVDWASMTHETQYTRLFRS